VSNSLVADGVTEEVVLDYLFDPEQNVTAFPEDVRISQPLSRVCPDALTVDSSFV
jgi:hypothetical protein